MPAVDVRAFLGISPMINKELLPAEGATLAENTRLEGGDMEPWRTMVTTKTLTSVADIKTIYRYGMDSDVDTDFWFQFTTDVNIVKGPIAGDTEERTYWTGDGYPKKTRSNIATTGLPYPSNSFALGIPAPAAAPSVSISGTATAPDDDPTLTAVWGYTYVTTWEEEGPMSPLSTDYSWQPGQTPDLSGLSGNPAGPYTIDRKRIYRAVVGTNATDFQLVGEIPVATTTFSDTTTSPGRTAFSRLWVGPPDNLAGLDLMANEIMVGYSGQTVRMSEPGVPYAWPTKNSWTMPATITGIRAFGTSVLVATKRSMHVLTGNHPSAISEQMLRGVGVCVSKRGMVNMLDGVLYPSTRGLEYVGPSGAQLLSQQKFDEKEWAAYAPSSFTAAQIGTRYFACYDTGVVKGSIIFSFVTPDAVTTTTVWGSALWQDKSTDQLYIVQQPGNVIRRWDSVPNTYLTSKWKSKEYTYRRDINMAAARVEAFTYPLTFKLYANGVLKHTQTVLDAYAFPLPDGYEATRYSFQYEGTSVVTRISMATSFDELRMLNG
jgi:hypothetical protein